MGKDNELIYKYLCLALPYRVIVDRLGDKHTLIGIDIKNRTITIDNGYYIPNCYYIDDLTGFPIKPYLRSIDSITEEEEIELNNLINKFGNKWIDSEISSERWKALFWESTEILDYLLKKHLDFMGLIHKGLAIKVDKINNPYLEIKL